MAPHLHSPPDILLQAQDVPVLFLGLDGVLTGGAVSRSEAGECAHHVTTATGGQGAARELCNLLLVAGGRYANLLEQTRQVQPVETHA